jgi:ligand-binding sensor domain-containing protein/AraC-like DNA-binding protein
MPKKLYKILCIFLLMLVVSIDARADDKNLVFISYDASNGLADNSVQIVRCTKTGRILIFTIGHVNFYDGDSFVHIDPSNRDVIRLPGYQGNYQLFFDKYHHLWGKNRGVLVCVNLLTERFMPDVREVLRDMGVTKPIDDLYGDGECNMWFRTGKQLSDPKMGKEFTIRAEANLQDVDLFADSLLMMFHADGSVGVYDYKHPRFLYVDNAFDTKEERLRYAQSSILCLVGDKYYQIRNAEQSSVLMCYDISKRRWTKVLEMPFRMNDLYPKDDKLYIASERGYLVYYFQTGEVKHYETVQLSKGRSMSPNINSLMFDRQGGLWLGTQSRGLLYAKAYPSPFSTIPSNSPEAQPYLQLLDKQKVFDKPLPYKLNCVLSDSRGWLWKGTYTGLVVERPGKPVLTISRKDGLINEVVHAIIEDDEHHLWISTSYGIARLYIKDDGVSHLEVYINQDNIPNDAFLNRRAAKMDDGTIVMQSIDHVVVFNPAHFQGEHFGDMELFPKLCRLMVNGVFVEPGAMIDGRVILLRSVSRTHEMHVNYNQNSLSMVFSGLNYLRPVQTYYRVRVKGVSEYNNWRVLSYGKSGGMVDRNGLLHLSLVGLTPGDYVIEMQTSMWPDKWLVQPYTWIIHVDKPWWRTTGLYILLAVVLLVLLIANFYYFNLNTKMRMRRLNEEEDMLHRLRGFADRCAELHDEQLSPIVSVEDKELVDDNTQESKSFDDVMLKLVPYVTKHRNEKVRFSVLADLTGMSKSDLFVLLAKHIDKNPRILISKLRLQEAAELLLTTNISVEDIADSLHFVSPNFFVTSFYHRYRVTPMAYRNSNDL